MGSAGGNGMMGSPREFFLIFAEIKRVKSGDAKINHRRIQNKLPPMLALGLRVKMRAIIQNPVRLPVRIMIVLLSSWNLDIKNIGTTSSFILLCGLVVGGSCLKVGAVFCDGMKWSVWGGRQNLLVR